MTAFLARLEPRARLAGVVLTALALAAGVGLPRIPAQAVPGVNFLSISSAAGDEGTGGAKTLDFTVTLNPATVETVTVKYSTSPGTAREGAELTTPGADYRKTSGTLEFAPTQTTKTISVPLVTDDETEPDEAFTVTLSEPTNASLRSGAESGTGTIRNDDQPLTVSLVDDAVVTEGDTGTVNAEIVILLSRASSREVAVDFATSETGSTATAGSDYTPVGPVTVTFAPGQLSKVVTIPVHGDTVGEPDETVALKLSNARVASIDQGTATLTIDDDESVVSVDDPAPVEEGDDNVAFTVSLDRPSDVPVRVNYETRNGTATSPADYAATSGTLEFAIGETSKTVEVPIKQDALDEPDETFTIALTGPTSATISTSEGEGTGTIADEDSPPVVSINDVTAPEGGVANFSISLSSPSGRDVTVKVNTADGSATGEVDYEEINNVEVTIAAGSPSIAFPIRVEQDSLVEGNETFTANLSPPSTKPMNATLGKATGTATVTDDDAPPPSDASARITTGVAPGGDAHVRSFNGRDRVDGEFYALAQQGGVRVARGDLDNDGTDEIIAGGGPGGAPIVAVFDHNGAFIAGGFAYNEAFRGGISVAAGDLDGDGTDEIITGPGRGGGPHVKAFGLGEDDDGPALFETDGFYGADGNHTGGLNVAAGDLDGDGKDEVLTAHASASAPIVRMFRYDPETNAASRYTVGNPDGAFLAYQCNAAGCFTGGVTIAAGDTDGNGLSEIITGTAGGAAPHVRMFNGSGGSLTPGIYVYSTEFHGGVTVAAGDLSGDNKAEIVTGAGAGGGPHVRAFTGAFQPYPPVEGFYAYAPNFSNGIFVSVGRN